MKNKLRFAVFLISRFKGLIIEGVGLGIFLYYFVQILIGPLVVTDHAINYDSNMFYKGIVCWVLMTVGLLIRSNSKNPLFHSTKTDKTLVIAGFVVFIVLTSLRLINIVDDVFFDVSIFLDITIVLIIKRLTPPNKTKTKQTPS